MIDKIKHDKRYGSDINKYLIALLEKARDDINSIPDTITKEQYINVRANYLTGEYEDWYIGLVGFCASYNAKWFGGYAGDIITKTGVHRNYTEEAIRNLKKQSPQLKNIIFKAIDFRDISSSLKDWVIYCDIPYRDTTNYKNDDFPYEEFYEWAKKMSEHNYVFISEYNMPDDFECIWTKEINCDIDNKQRLKRTEKLWRVKNGK